MKMKWRNVFLTILATLVVTMFLSQTHRWWVSMILLVFAAGVYIERRNRELEARAAASLEDSDEGSGAGVLLIVLILAVAGIGWGLFNSAGWWSIALAVANAIVFPAAILLSSAAGDEAEKVAALRTVGI